MKNNKFILLIIFLLFITATYAKKANKNRNNRKTKRKMAGNPYFSRTEYDLLKRQISKYIPEDKAQKRVASEAFHREALILEGDRTPVDVILRRMAALLNDIKRMNNHPDLRDEASLLNDLKKRNKKRLNEEELQPLFKIAKKLQRKIAFKNPLLNFSRIIFLKHHKQARGERHMVDQYLGFNARKGGGLYLLENAFSGKPVVKSLLAGSPVVNGRLKGKILENNGSFISLDLDYDAESILFAFTEAEYEVPDNGSYANQYWSREESRKAKRAKHYYYSPETTYHIFRADIDGSDLRQLTDGMMNDFDPSFLPNGRIVFITERNGGNLRCGNRPLPSATLSSMMGDGSDIIQLSFHDTQEWHPSVDNNGMIIYTRWDYIDRDSDIAQHIWHSFPDGRDPRSYHGNYPDMREMRPWMEMSIRSIPGSHKYISTAAPHHGEAYGSLVMIDINKEDDRAMSQVKRITPEVHLPESEMAPGVPGPKHAGKYRIKAEVYGTPWPLSEKYYLYVYDNNQKNYGIYLGDCFGNRVLLYRDKDIPCLDPIPLKSRNRPPVIPVQTKQAKKDRKNGDDLSYGTVSIMNIYESEYDWPKGSKIKELRIINIFPKPNPFQDKPRIGHADQSLARGILGTVPVEEDGSVYFRMPAGAPIYFQAIDENGLCIQTMRSITYVHPGEKLSCLGCHEKKDSSPGNKGRKISAALKRAPSEIKPAGKGSYPLSFPRLVQPVLDRNCLGCHEKNEKSPGLSGEKFGKFGWSEAFHTLQKLAWGKHGGNGKGLKKNGRSYSIPGKDGARVSKLYWMLKNGHYNVKLSLEEFQAITLWIDCNSNFYGAYVEPLKQARGDLVKPKWGIPKWTEFSKLAR